MVLTRLCVYVLNKLNKIKGDYNEKNSKKCDFKQKYTKFVKIFD